MIGIGTRVRFVGPTAAGGLGTVLLVTAVGDGFLVETDDQFTAGLGTYQRTESLARQRRRWCATDELRVVSEPGWVSRQMARVRRTDPPLTLEDARRSSRSDCALPAAEPNVLQVADA